jgi:hypothetical protein
LGFEIVHQPGVGASEEPVVAVIIDLAVVAHRARGDGAAFGVGGEHREIDVAHHLGEFGQGLGHDLLLAFGAITRLI